MLFRKPQSILIYVFLGVYVLLILVLLIVVNVFSWAILMAKRGRMCLIHSHKNSLSLDILLLMKFNFPLNLPQCLHLCLKIPIHFFQNPIFAFPLEIIAFANCAFRNSIKKSIYCSLG